MTFIGIWRPQTDKEVQEIRHVAGLYNVEGVIEVWDKEQLEALLSRLGATLVCLEMDTHATPLGMFMHPFDPFYLVGPLNGSIPKDVLDLAGRIVQIESPKQYPLRPSVAAAIVLHDNHIQASANSQRETA